MIYAGIGARATPVDVQQRMAKLANALALCGHKLRSGGARGADLAFMSGAFNAFNAKRDGFDAIFNADDARGQAAWEVHARLFHPAFDKLSPYAQLLMARNSAIILGASLQSPVKCVLCWTPGGRVVGGTGQALRIAAAYRIPVFNLFDPSADVRVWEVAAHG